MRQSSFITLPILAKEEDRKIAVPAGEVITTFVVKELELEDNHYTLTIDDSNDFLVFNSDNNIIIHIPDNYPKGFGVLATNVGSGTIEVVMDGLEKLRGWHTLTDPDSFMSLVKLTMDYWQSSERR